MRKHLTAALLVTTLFITILPGCTAQEEKNTSESSAQISSDTEKTDKTSSKELTPVTLNEVAHSIFYAPMYVAIENGYFSDEGILLDLVTGFGAI